MLLQVNSVESLGSSAFIPSSKPETQRAIIAATLAKGTSLIHNDLRCFETDTMKQACRNIGAIIEEKEGFLKVQGVGRRFTADKRVIDAVGSGLVFRVFTAITSFGESAEIVTGDTVLRTRVMAPLFDALETLGASIHCISEPGKAPIVNWGGGFKGGHCIIPGNVSSQFITAIMFAAPMADEPTRISISGEILSSSYIRQTIDTLEKAGIKVEAKSDLAEIIVYPGEYQTAEYLISGDYTSSSYLIGAAAIIPGTTVLSNISSKSLQGERAIIDVIKALGVKVSFDDQRNELTLFNEQDELSGEFEFDASDYPNIVPTLAAIGAYVQGTFRVIGGSITRLHKSPRIEAIISELKTLGVDITPLLKDGVYDGFVIHGKSHYEGGKTLSSWGDHRIFMSLFVASLRCKNANLLEGYSDVICSFPSFFNEFKQLGVKFKEVEQDIKDGFKRA
ncbi:3-phosphoshikimate 1-carboxyvinyltransferase [uncultured Shewanella sp.]|uniref:3-phosphoshikimate 1-carboxyvinyltransferase n=1 Tax=uncultured Shewanella sp. TaxID=173975 RepID=UPI00262A51A5|nr:3-phosphoshikimate 1-carboxyvinyltransferase [uncultured Shewanella sp.]